MITVRALILEIFTMQFSQTARLRLFATDRNRTITLYSLGLIDRMNISAAVRIPRDGEFLFFGKFLDGIDSDISMHKRAREVAGSIAKPSFCNASRRQRFSIGHFFFLPRPSSVLSCPRSRFPPSRTRQRSGLRPRYLRLVRYLSVQS